MTRLMTAVYVDDPEQQALVERFLRENNIDWDGEWEDAEETDSELVDIEAFFPDGLPG